MADQIRHRTVTVPAGTLKAAPFTVDISFAPAEVDWVEIYIPPGHAGFTGIALAQAHQPVIPYDVGEFIVRDDDKIRMDIDGYLDSGNWQAIAYNTDTFDHAFYLLFGLQVVTRAPVIVGGPTPFVAPAIPEEAGGVSPVGEPIPGPVSEPAPAPEPEPEPAPEPEPPPEPEQPPDEPAPNERAPDELPPDVPPPEELPPDAPEPAPAPPPPPPPPGWYQGGAVPPGIEATGVSVADGYSVFWTGSAVKHLVANLALFYGALDAQRRGYPNGVTWPWNNLPGGYAAQGVHLAQGYGIIADRSSDQIVWLGRL